MKKSKKILFITHLYSPSIGGAEFVYQMIAEELVQRGNQVTVLTSDGLSTEDYIKGKDNNLLSFEVVHGVKVFRQRSFSLFQFGMTPIWKFVNYFIFLRNSIGSIFFGPHFVFPKPILQETYDVIIGGPTPTSAPIYAFFLSKVKRIPFIFFPHFHPDDFLHSSLINRFILRSANKVICTTESEKQSMISLGISKKNILRINNPLSPKLLKMDVFQEKNDSVLFLGQEGRHKNIPMLIGAMQKIWEDGYKNKLVIAGRRTDFSIELDTIVANSKFPEMIERINNISDEAKVDLIDSALLLVNPSFQESFGLVFIEAWSRKIPVIGNDIPAVSELIESDSNGLIFDYNSLDSLTDALKRLINNENLRKKFGNNGYRKVQENFMIENLPLELLFDF